MLAYLKAFLVGGLLCAIGQLLIDKTKMTPARILVVFVVSGVALTALGLYEPLIKWAGAGASVPLSGFGYALAKGVERSVSENGILGALTGGLSATSAGVAAAIFFGLIAALLAKPRDKS